MEKYDRNIPKDKFQFAQKETALHDTKFETKPVGYLHDAWNRFKKNKSSVAALCIILFLIVFAVVAPLISQYKLTDGDNFYQNKRPFHPAFANAGFWDGGRSNEFTEANYLYYKAIGDETGLDPILKKGKEYDKVQNTGENSSVTHMYNLRIQTYYEVGIINTLNLSKADFDRIQDYQLETGRQILYPLVDTDKLYGFDTREGGGNYWYEINRRGVPQLDENGNFRPLYLTGGASSDFYYSTRVEGDDGSYVYGRKNQSGYATRICYYEYYVFLHGHGPEYLFGTNTYGQDIFCALGKGAQFSLLLALFVSAINLTIGAIYGALEGFYGGAADLVMERISDVLSGVPFTVVVTLFSYHLAPLVGVIPSFLFAFISTGWISMAALTRKQFYRFKNQEYVMAAKTLGARDRRVIWKHIFPNSLGTIITSAVMVIPSVIGTETILTYLGIVNLSGSSSSVTSLGVLIQLGQAYMGTAPHVMLFPALFLALLMISFNLFGNGLRDAFNPSLRGVEE